MSLRAITLSGHAFSEIRAEVPDEAVLKPVVVVKFTGQHQPTPGDIDAAVELAKKLASGQQPYLVLPPGVDVYWLRPEDQK